MRKPPIRLLILMRALLWAGAILWLWGAGAAAAPAATRVEYQFVEATADIAPDGRCVWDYAVRLKVLSGELHGFYFQGLGRATPVWDFPSAMAETSGGARYPLSITPVGADKWDIILAGGRAIRSGEVTYLFRFACDLADAEVLDWTDSPQSGRLAVFNYALTEWDAPLGHATCLLRFPIEAPESARWTGPPDPRRPGTQPEDAVGPEFLEAIGFRTEPWVNRDWKISYLATEARGKRWFTLRLHRDRVAAREALRWQV